MPSYLPPAKQAFQSRLRLVDDAHKQRQAVCPGDGEHEGTVQNKVHFLLRWGGFAAHHHNGIGRGGDAFLVNGHAGGVLAWER